MNKCKKCKNKLHSLYIRTTTKNKRQWQTVQYKYCTNCKKAYKNYKYTW